MSEAKRTRTKATGNDAYYLATLAVFEKNGGKATPAEIEDAVGLPGYSSKYIHVLKGWGAVISTTKAGRNIVTYNLVSKDNLVIPTPKKRGRKPKNPGGAVAPKKVKLPKVAKPVKPIKADDVKARTLAALKKAGVAIVNPARVPGPKVSKDNVVKVRKAVAAAEKEKVPTNDPEVEHVVDQDFSEFDLKELGDFAPSDKYSE